MSHLRNFLGLAVAVGFGFWNGKALDQYELAIVYLDANNISAQYAFKPALEEAARKREQ